MLYHLVWLFFCYGFAGWILETVVAMVRNRRFINRGLLDGPLCALYGIAGALVSVSLADLRGNWLFLFLGSAIYCTVLEWLAGHLLEHSHYGRWWDYSKVKWNLDGYVCLPFSALWGVLGLVAVQWISPALLFVYDLLPSVAAKTVLLVLLFLTAVDGIGSLLVLYGHGGWMPLQKMDGQITAWTGRFQRWIVNITATRLEKGYIVPRREKPVVAQGVFAAGLGFYKLFWLFFLGSFLGDIAETIFCRITGGTWMSRSSVVFGPFSLVWGIALAMATLLLYRYQTRSDGFLFWMGTLMGGAYEYLCSVFTEICFGTVFWDYSKIPFNLGGRINLLYCFFWGIAAVAWMKRIYPKLSAWIEKIPMKIGKPLTGILVVFMVVNISVSGLALLRYNERSQQLPATQSWQVWMDTYYDDTVMERIYPNAKKVATK